MRPHSRYTSRSRLSGEATLRAVPSSKVATMVFSLLLQDLRYSFRTMRRNAGFTVFAILIAGLGVGASATVFGVVNTLILRPLPFEKSSDLVWIANRDLP